ncbi:MAG: hypothetical protein ACHQQQ_09535 [Bacteroidota bacterium]
MTKYALIFGLSVLAYSTASINTVSAQIKQGHPKVLDTTDPEYRHSVSRSPEKVIEFVKNFAIPDSTEAIRKEVESTPAHPDTYGALHDPLPAVQFDEFLLDHNMSIASDGKYYYTINGGNAAWGRIKRYTLAGKFVDSVNVGIDGRSIMYNKADGCLYVGGWNGNLYRMAYKDRSAELVHGNLFDYSEASPAMSEDGNYIYGFYAGTLKKYSIADGSVVETLTGLRCGTGNFGGDGAVAVDKDYIFTWDAATQTVFVYTLQGVSVRSFKLGAGDNGMSLSFVNGRLFVSRDGNYGMGTWYGYDIRSFVPAGKHATRKPLPSSKPGC